MARGSKDGPNGLSNYRAIHDTVIQQFLRAGFIRSEDLSILSGDGPNAVVQTVDYSYNAFVRGVGNILRYDSPHPDHNQEHHRHRFDVFAGEELEPPLFLTDESTRPTLGEVIEEVRGWYHENIDRLFARGEDLPS